MPELLKEHIDFYFSQDGKMVFTETYHLGRGYCCGHDCRHCPYNHIQVPGRHAGLNECSSENDRKESGRLPLDFL